MEIGVWLLVVALTIALAYTMRLSSATLSMGRGLSGGGSKRGSQDAITPPWLTNLVWIVYVSIAVVLGVTWWLLGWVLALVALAVVFVGSSLVKLVLPTPSGSHYERLILQSMITRHANYVRDGDKLRADAMKQLLAKAGLDPNTMRGE